MNDKESDYDREKAILEREASATPGPWNAYRSTDGRIWIEAAVGDKLRVVLESLGDNKNAVADITFAKEARQDVPWLADRLTIERAKASKLEADLVLERAKLARLEAREKILLKAIEIARAELNLLDCASDVDGFRVTDIDAALGRAVVEKP